ncbi:DUF2505 domain-containing protein [Ferrimonas lipolytica]|uniref:DUF2505 domain-containing protein n=1 Tax=Ferrimonas lipolytica TaxID=2724191 RepID=A0A6H1UBG1_9GAMM|nr:DUF2505 domain-containing protein [Ferrimonas lipolytica]QIZ75546.1 DUF2505 domain-containing protein [Ferrimonas lipolytica]
MVKIEAVHPYPCHASELLAYFMQEALIVEKYQQIGSHEVHVTVSDRVDCTEVCSQRLVASEIPAKLKSFLGDTNKLTQTEQWQTVADEHFECQFITKLDGVPITIDGQMELINVADGCENRVTLTLKCALPFVGKKLEQFVGSSSEQMMEDEFQYLLSSFVEA